MWMRLWTRSSSVVMLSGNFHDLGTRPSSTSSSSPWMSSGAFNGSTAPGTLDGSSAAGTRADSVAPTRKSLWAEDLHWLGLMGVSQAYAGPAWEGGWSSWSHRGCRIMSGDTGAATLCTLGGTASRRVLLLNVPAGENQPADHHFACPHCGPTGQARRYPHSARSESYARSGSS